VARSVEGRQAGGRQADGERDVAGDGRWRKSSASGQSACVEVARSRDGHTVLLRDSKAADGPRLRLTPAAWRTFLAGAKAGEFDDLWS
jgi:hypothetical protein